MTTNFEYNPALSASRQKMFVICGSVLPFILGFHHVVTGADGGKSISILGTAFDASKVKIILTIWLIGMVYFTLGFFLRLIQEWDSTRGLSDLESEIRNTNKAVEALNESADKLSEAIAFFGKEDLNTKFENLPSIESVERAGRELKSVLNSASLITNEMDLIKSGVIKKGQLNQLQWDSLVQNISETSNQIDTKIRLISNPLSVIQNFVKQSTNHNSQRQSALDTLNQLGKIKAARKRQILAIKIRWLGVEGIVPLVFGVVMIVFTICYVV